MLHYFLTSSPNHYGSAMDTARVTSKGQVTIPKQVRGEQRSLKGLLSKHAKDRTVDGKRLRKALHYRAAAKYAAR